MPTVITTPMCRRLEPFAALSVWAMLTMAAVAGSCLLHGSVAPSGAGASGGAVLCEFAEAFTTKLTVLATA